MTLSEETSIRHNGEEYSSNKNEVNVSFDLPLKLYIYIILI